MSSVISAVSSVMAFKCLQISWDCSATGLAGTADTSLSKCCCPFISREGEQPPLLQGQTAPTGKTPSADKITTLNKWPPEKRLNLIFYWNNLTDTLTRRACRPPPRSNSPLMQQHYNSQDTDFYFDLHQITHTQKNESPKHAWFFFGEMLAMLKKVKKDS